MKSSSNQNKWMFVITLVLAGVINVNAQSTFNRVYTLLQSNCSGSGCHSGSSPVSFSVDGSETDVYNAIVSVVPKNTSAAQKGYKLIDPGHPYKSFLLKKIGSSFDSYMALALDEGYECPQSGHALLADEDIELVRQWIMKGAPNTGNVVDYQILQNYYTNGGLPFIPVPQAPNPSEGFQVRYGPIFLNPQEEKEFLKKERLGNMDLMKVWKLEGRMTIESHHMLLYIRSDAGSGAREGLRQVPLEAVPFLAMTLTGAWQDDIDFELPAPSAFYWQPNTILDFDYHVKNYSSTQILPNDFYLNVYFDTENQRNIEMHVDLVNDFTLILPQGIQTRTNTYIFPETRYIHSLTSHTHKYGIDFDMYVNNNGVKGEQLFEGFYNTEYTYNQGSYSWEHPPTRYFDPLKKVEGGLIYEVKWDVQQPLVTFGPTTSDEMMLFYYSYTTEPLPQNTGVETITSENKLSIFPNPSNGRFVVSYSMPETALVKMELFNMIGERVSLLKDEMQTKGSHSDFISTVNLPSDVYFIRLSSDQFTRTSKIVVEN